MLHLQRAKLLQEIKDVIITYPEAKAVVLIGVRDEKWGEAVKVVVVSRKAGEITEQEIIDYCRRRIASLKKPKSVDFVKELPLNPYGKVLKRALRQPYWKGLEGKVR